MPRYVAHISGQGEKWEVLCQQHYYCEEVAWQVKSAWPSDSPLYLPKSEYREVPPPERWVDVTGMCEVVNGCLLHRLPEATPIVCELHIHATSYRLRKVQVMNAAGNMEWAFKVEKREP